MRRKSNASSLFFALPCGTLKNMLRLLNYSVLILLFLVQTAFAQESVRVRTGEHDEYSRLVFDGKKRIQYSVEKA